jgi:predicted HTH transcriptional regulator
MKEFLEDKHTEYKRELSESLEKEAIAFLNSLEGGRIYIGIDAEEKRVAGVIEPDQAQLEIKDRLKNNISPSILGLFDVRIERYEEKPVILVTVAAGMEKPYYLKRYGMSEKGCFLRVGSASEPMPLRVIDDLYASRTRNSISLIRSTRQDLTFMQLRIFYQENGLELSDNFARTLELLAPDGGFNYAGYLLADENATSIKVAKYSGKDRSDLIENNEYGYCCLVKSAQRVLDKMEIENRTFTKITGKARLQRRMIDEFALREAVINAIIHNDYTNEVPPKFEFFSDRLEITSTGSLPPGLSVEEFFSGISIPRNKVLMRVFKDLALVEYLGSGIPRILRVYDRSVFSFTDHFLRVVFPFEEGFESSSTEGVNEGVNEGVKRVYAFILKNAGCRIPQISHATGISEKTLERYIKLLRDNGKVEFVGAPKTGGYRALEGDE